MTIMAQNMGLIESSARLLSKRPPEKEIIHSGHFMVSNFEAEAQDDEDVFVSNPELVKSVTISGGVILNSSVNSNIAGSCIVQRPKTTAQHIAIETSLTKLFQCMSLAYRNMCKATDKENGFTLEPPTQTKLQVQKKLSLVVEMLWIGVLILPSILWEVYRKIFPPEGKSLKGQVAVVTGGGRGLGRGLAVALAREGCRVAVADINLDNAEETAAEINQLGGTAKAFPVNVAKVAEVKRLHSAVTEQLGPVDLLVNNAGLIHGERLLNYDDHHIQAVLDVNLASHFWMVREFLPSMKKRNKGHVVAIASVSSFLGIPGSSAYTACKFGIRGLMESLRMELEEEPGNNIKTTTVYPYFINTSATYMDHWDLRLPAISIEETVERVVRGMRLDEVDVTVPGQLYCISHILRLLPQNIIDMFRQIFYTRILPARPDLKAHALTTELAKEYELAHHEKH